MVLLAGVGAAVVLLRFPALVPAPSPRSVPVVRADVAAEIDVRGTVRSATEAGASFAVGGTVASVDVTPGTTVRAGDVLAMLDDSGARPRVQAASSALDADVRALSAARAAPVPDQVAIGRLTADVANDRAVLADAERVLADTVLRAPRDGTVTAVAGQVGDRVIAGTPSPTTPEPPPVRLSRRPRRARRPGRRPAA